MFHYAAFIDEKGQTSGAVLAERLTASEPGWQLVYAAGRVRVLCRGLRARSSEVYELQGGAGVVLGKLFERVRGSGRQRHAPLILEPGESRAILASAGRHLISHYWGRYVACLHDPSTAEVSIVRSPSGTLPCFHLRIGSTHLYVSHLEHAERLMEEPLTIRWDYIASWLAARVHGRETALCEVSRILGGECERFHGNVVQREIYWNPLEIAGRGRSETLSEAAERLRGTLRSTVHAWSECYDNRMLFLSGGLDSSILAKCLSDAPGGQRAHCYHHYVEGPAGRASDEREYASDAARAAGLPLHMLPRTAQVDLQRMLSMRSTPTLWNLIHAVELGAVEAGLAPKEGSTAHFVGEGGDQALLQSGGTHAAAGALAHMGFSQAWFTVALDAARMDREFVGNVIARAVLAQLPFGKWHPRELIGHDRTLLTKKTLKAARNARLTHHPWFSNAQGATDAARWHATLLMTERPFYDPLLPDADLPDPIAPFLEQQVKEEALRSAPQFLIYSGWDRALARIAFETELPESVLTRRVKGSFEDHARGMLEYSRAFAQPFLREGELARRGIIDPRGIDEAFSPAGKTDNLELFDLLTAEAWVRSRRVTQHSKLDR